MSLIGENIYSAELEDAAYSYGPQIIDVAAFGIPHSVLGEEVAMIVTASPSEAKNVKSKAVLDHMKKKLAPFKIPVYFEIRTEMLPRYESIRIFQGLTNFEHNDRNANQKILKNDLKAEVVEKLKQLKAAVPECGAAQPSLQSKL